MLNWRLLAERRILAAMERGEFDNLPGQGQPLVWPENTLVPWEWRLAFDLLEQAGLAPDWIMRDAEIRADLAALQDQLERERLWMAERCAAMTRMSPQEQWAERARLGQVQAQSWEKLKTWIEQINRKIADFNLVVPMVWLQRTPLDLVQEERTLRAAWAPTETEEVQ